MDDEDDTQRSHKSRPKWGDDQRASTASERRARMRSSGVPIVPDAIERELGGGELGGYEVTKPWEVLDRDELNADEVEIIRRSRRDSQDPVVYADLVKVISRAMKKELDDRSAEKQHADRILDLVKHPPHEAVRDLQVRMPLVEKGLDHVTGTVSVATKIVSVVLIAALGALGYVAAKLWAGGQFEGEFRVRVDHAEKAIDRLQSPADRLWLTPPLPPTKDKP